MSGRQEKVTLGEYPAHSEDLTDKDRLNYMNTIKDKVLENQQVVQQLQNNTPDQVMIGDYPGTVQDAVMESLQTHSGLASQLLQNEKVSKEFARLLLDVILKERMVKNQIILSLMKRVHLIRD